MGGARREADPDAKRAPTRSGPDAKRTPTRSGPRREAGPDAKRTPDSRLPDMGAAAREVTHAASDPERNRFSTLEGLSWTIALCVFV
ncbi:MAG: hypothetical protein EA351_08870 [Gemmatimonadales bacterium]|nr:MAG: hypothetical protein EA351_08870 [Gemmatimonadales bacterium]